MENNIIKNEDDPNNNEIEEFWNQSQGWDIGNRFITAKNAPKSKTSTMRKSKTIFCIPKSINRYKFNIIIFYCNIVNNYLLIIQSNTDWIPDIYYDKVKPELNLAIDKTVVQKT